MTLAATASRYALHSVWRSHVGRVRAINEDRVFDDAATGIWAVADGMGGHDGGDLAAQQVIDCLRKAVHAHPAADPRLARDALLTANAAIRARNLRLGLNAGTTAVAATFVQGMLDIVWAGDSRAYRIEGGVARQLTRDHSVVQQLVEAGLLTSASAEHHPQAHVVTRALGIEDVLDLDSCRVDASAGRFLLCSDGLSRSLNPDGLTPGLSLAALADELIAQALERDGTDNVSLVLIEVERVDGR